MLKRSLAIFSLLSSWAFDLVSCGGLDAGRSIKFEKHPDCSGPGNGREEQIKVPTTESRNALTRRAATTDIAKELADAERRYATAKRELRRVHGLPAAQMRDKTPSGADYHVLSRRGDGSWDREIFGFRNLHRVLRGERNGGGRVHRSLIEPVRPAPGTRVKATYLMKQGLIVVEDVRRRGDDGMHLSDAIVLGWKQAAAEDRLLARQPGLRAVLYINVCNDATLAVARKIYSDRDLPRSTEKTWRSKGEGSSSSSRAFQLLAGTPLGVVQLWMAADYPSTLRPVVPVSVTTVFEGGVYLQMLFEFGPVGTTGGNSAAAAASHGPPEEQESRRSRRLASLLSFCPGCPRPDRGASASSRD